MLTLRRTFATLAFALSITLHLGFLPGSWFIYHPYYLWKFPPEIWRIVTSFFITGSGLNLLFDTYFVYKYMSQLEIGHPRFPRKEDLLWYMTFVGGVILVGFQFLACMPWSSAPFPKKTPHISARIVLCLFSYHGSWN